MNKILRNLIFGPPNYFYVRVYKNKMHIRKIGDEIKEIEVQATEPFSSERLLVGEFSIAENLLSNVFRELGESRLLSKGPMVVMQPMEMHNISEVEERVLRELAYGSRAFIANVWVGKELTDEEVKIKATAKNI